MVARLIHLNGPSRVGKSTLARRYAAEHPGTLNLDVDVLVGLIGGWQQDFSAAFAVARRHAIELGVRHLMWGSDVVLPQLITSFDGEPWADEIAARAGAEYVEIVLTVSPELHKGRLGSKAPEHDVDAHIQLALSEPDHELLAAIRRDLQTYLADRPSAIPIDTDGLGPDAAYRLLLAALGEAAATD